MNKSISRTVLTIMCVFVPAGTTGAQSIEEARSVYAEGRFAEAAELARMSRHLRRLCLGGRFTGDLQLLPCAGE